MSWMDIPFIMTCFFITSRVVPASLATMAVSSFPKQFIKLDFPTLGFPARTTEKLSWSITPLFAPMSNSSKHFSKLTIISINFGSLKKSMSSSEKSIAASTNTRVSVKLATIDSTAREKSPCKDLIADLAASSEELEIKSATASA